MRPDFAYLPEITSQDRAPAAETKGAYPCPCCGYLTLPAPKEQAAAFICPVCFWENDVFLSGDEEPSDLNHGLTLKEGRENYLAFGACSEKMRPYVRGPKPEERP